MSASVDPGSKPPLARTPLRVVSVQIEAQFRNVQRNAEKVNQLLEEKLAAGTDAEHETGSEVDLIVLSEMVLTGYMFRDRAEVEGYTEWPWQSTVAPAEEAVKEASSSTTATPTPTLDVCRSLAKHYSCYVIAGVPVRAPLTLPTASHPHSISKSFDARPSPDDRKASGLPPPQSEKEQGWYNAALLVDPKGELVHLFRKHFLYEAEEGWACEGPGFTSITLPHPRDPCTSFKLGCGICMDLSPHTFSAPFDKYEFSSWAAKEECDVVACPMAWLAMEQKQPLEERRSPEASKTAEVGSDNSQEDSDEEEREPLQPDQADPRMLNYWALRLMPLVRQVGKTTTVVLCNRIGYERGTTFGGSSCVLKLGSNKAMLLAAAGSGTEEVIGAEASL
ncbi:hypothetical protein CBOM_04941 [Ceraceosorus bombacis]|uniref:CN hydrolase domain-containing protein n=1 Tax=Ceraceosorus bombacis TaxID=401625 RepID=A0A0P1BIP9_9BASI|nr:hypothetical protein CBOM_04941 [Ceraceosorus bombacis]